MDNGLIGIGSDCVVAGEKILIIQSTPMPCVLTPLNKTYQCSDGGPPLPVQNCRELLRARNHGWESPGQSWALRDCRGEWD